MAKKKRMTWPQLNLLCEAVRRITRFNDGKPTGCYHGLGYATDYRPVLQAGLMKPVGKLEPRHISWFVLTAAGEEIVCKMLAAGLTYKHIEYTQWDNNGSPNLPPVGFSSFTEAFRERKFSRLKTLILNPTAFIATHYFRNEKHPLTAVDLSISEVAPGRK